ncbi:hypothetical protein Glove_707g43 [Diversispora epigaea]|uniref:Uncharacterized protein n=1 Tax=Diversispora epigaea TaxID=1348612 RepID=A0A397G1I9_9GLOM|nr:hypothetical protein Glove_707g43 [Diversispora epigaea]
MSHIPKATFPRSSFLQIARNRTQRGEPQCQYYKKDHEDHDPASTQSQMSHASAHIARLLPYHSYKVYPKALAEIARSSAHIPNLLPYRSYKVAIEKTPEDLARLTEI